MRPSGLTIASNLVFSFSGWSGSANGGRTSSRVGISRGSGSRANLSSKAGISVRTEAIELMLAVVTEDILECDDPYEERLLRLSENLCFAMPGVPAATA